MDVSHFSDNHGVAPYVVDSVEININKLYHDNLVGFFSEHSVIFENFC